MNRERTPFLPPTCLCFDLLHITFLLPELFPSSLFHLCSETVHSAYRWIINSLRHWALPDPFILILLLYGGRLGRKKNLLLVSQKQVCVCIFRNVLLIFLDNLPLTKNCWCWSCKGWTNFLRGSNCELSRKLLGNVRFCLQTVWRAEASKTPTCMSQCLKKMGLFSSYRKLCFVGWMSAMWPSVFPCLNLSSSETSLTVAACAVLSLVTLISGTVTECGLCLFLLPPHCPGSHLPGRPGCCDAGRESLPRRTEVCEDKDNFTWLSTAVICAISLVLSY